ncbi:MAG: octanoyltransferase [Piscirickettsiaceae bacterium CG_4_9_14_3_um_filter_43_564]|nr:lipoyl(octanoyl) transferase LipB [Thiomicrospira sp.]OIP94045.1 MAG: octanoyltransferase [Thiomicrospira sp. CG2_30_44_34]PIQ05489.1 MAG: octanoyltransferase [Piscirickettsiaceae bacterium CG18_big_fil_WC_8_21_14_2_50_44_103]PIU39244.1 MAG: octanoyltransferase [Piscirickettsiaceae bacterium CG07_land_8_20_14_0_80_44_28]PIW58281.1 MAG: octanoyltransferase [Piscirickettsiaceae bacterium CG12_big_fil_rev_8_21_14_0_65_44_934]PIW77009.1 MAG: octanoyltransferase [Piscirickettsiaceae bacterium CG
MTILIKTLGITPYETTWQAMQTFTNQRTSETADEIWLCQHPPTFTQGLNGQQHHLHPAAFENAIPIIQTDRGGQVTYHGPGQLICYLLLDLNRLKLGVRAFVTLMEQSLITLLSEINIPATAKADAPGVYVDDQKIASLGLKVRKHRTYHGLSLNVDMDMTPFQWITPCGLANIKMTQVRDWQSTPNIDALQTRLTEILIEQLQANPPTPQV